MGFFGKNDKTDMIEIEPNFAEHLRVTLKEHGTLIKDQLLFEDDKSVPDEGKVKVSDLFFHKKNDIHLNRRKIGESFVKKVEAQIELKPNNIFITMKVLLNYMGEGSGGEFEVTIQGILHKVF